MALILVLLVLAGTMAFFYLKCSMMQSFMTLWSALLATIVSFSFYEWVANLLISRGHALDMALFGSFTLLFVFILVALRAGSEFLIITSVDLGTMVKLPVALIGGLLTGLIISGNVLVALGLLPIHGKVFYSRFAPDAQVKLASPKKPALATDGFISGLYSLISSGSMRSSKSFGVLHTDYLSQIHLNKLKTGSDVLSVSSRDALLLPKGEGIEPVRRTVIDDKDMVVVRVGVQAKKIEDGGAGDQSGKMQFLPAQVRLITKEPGAAGLPLTGTATAQYAAGLWEDGEMTSWELGEIITPDSTKFVNRVCWMDIVFECPGEETPILLEFKQNAVIELPEAVESTQEIERALNSKEE
jgi:hypothetical protein